MNAACRLRPSAPLCDICKIRTGGRRKGAETAGVARNFAASNNYAQPSDPAKLACAILQLVNAEDPPLPMPFGSDAIRRFEAKNAFVAQELARRRDFAVSTDATSA